MREPVSEQNLEIDRVKAILHNSALDKLEEAVATDGRRAEDLIQQLDTAKQAKDYTAQRGLVEALLQRLDISDIRGLPASQEILEALNQVYVRASYSAVRQNILLEQTPKDDSTLLVDALIDEKFPDSTRLLSSIASEEVRTEVFEALKNKNAVKQVVSLVAVTRDRAVQVPLFEDLTSWLLQNSSIAAKEARETSYSEFNHIKREIGTELLKKDQLAFFHLLEKGFVTIGGLEDRIKDESDESLQSILLHVITLEDASHVIKFIRSKEALLTSESGLESALLGAEFHGSLKDRIQRLAAAFDAPPLIQSFGRLRERDASMSSYDVSNKFIVGLEEGENRATIAWSNTKELYEHKLIAQRVGNIPKSLCAGGQVELVSLEGGRIQVVFEGRSGTFGPYNQVFLERFKDAMAESLREELSTEVEVVVRPSQISL